MSTLPERQSVSDSSSEEDVKNCGKEADPTSVDFLKTGKDRLPMIPALGLWV